MGIMTRLKSSLGINPTTKGEPSPMQSVGDVYVNEATDTGIHKAYIPNYLYKPPFGYPRKENFMLIRNLSRSPYIYSIVRALQDEVASTKYDIVYKDDILPTPAMDDTRIKILEFLDNPNGNKESFQFLLKAIVRDMLELDSGILVKVFDRTESMKEIYARDGSSFLKNPDQYGYIGDREEIIYPSLEQEQLLKDMNVTEATIKQYEDHFGIRAAYFQYGFTGHSLPVPFGKREIVWLQYNPRSDSVYGQSPIAVLSDVITSLVFGANYNLDFYMNNNMPEGVIEILDADEEQIRAFRQRMDHRIRREETLTGFLRKIAFKIPIVNKQFKFTPFQLDPKIMQIIEQQEWFQRLVLSCFGIPADAMGFTDKSNKAVSDSQTKHYKRKAVRPLLQVLKYHLDKEIIPEWGEEAFKSLEFKWDDYDIEEDIKKHSLYQMQLNMGLTSPRLIAEEEGIDYSEVEKDKEEEFKKQIEMFEARQGASFEEKEEKKEEKEPKKKGKDMFENSVLEKELTSMMEAKKKQVLDALSQMNKKPIKNIR